MVAHGGQGCLWNLWDQGLGRGPPGPQDKWGKENREGLAPGGLASLPSQAERPGPSLGAGTLEEKQLGLGPGREQDSLQQLQGGVLPGRLGHSQGRGVTGAIVGHVQLL